MRKTNLMKEVEERIEKPLIEVLPEMLTENGLTDTAGELGVSKATLRYWILGLGIRVRRIALAPGEVFHVDKPDGTRTTLTYEEFKEVLDDYDGK